VEDCAGIWGGNTEVDECGTCGGMGPTLECSCEAIPEGACDCNGNVLDECGICGGAGIPDGACNCEGNEPEEYYNCEGNCIISGDADLDGVCDGQLAISNNLTPYNYSIQNIYPNPFNPVTHITYGLPEYTNVQIMVFDLTGKQIQSLISEFQSPGYHSIIWNAGSHPSGMYILRMQIDNKLNPKKNILSKKIMLLK
jgi:hypothetical protein